MLKRGSGILLHISSLPSEYGIGDLGKTAYEFADILKAAGQRYWQMLPLNPTDGVYGESPYSSPSAFAANPLFISPVLLCEAGFLAKEDSVLSQDFKDDHVEFDKVREYKFSLFQKAFNVFQKEEKDSSDYREFCSRESFWLDDYALFVVLKELYPGKRWDQWPDDIKKRTLSVLEDLRKQHYDQLEFVKFLQFIFYQQWHLLRVYCQELKIQLIGDIPIYVNEDSSDVWANPAYFKLDAKMRPQYVAGVPPDYFSETGQRWGNPVYDWKILKETKYEWWMKRLERQFELFDIVRIDHFRGLEAYWEVPAKEKTAVNGVWVDGPKDDFFKVLKDRFPGLPIIGEDLGIITDEVTALMDRFEIPGMKVLQFAFGGELETHPYIPENYKDNCVVYTGTHDNNTTRGWFNADTGESERHNLNVYLKKECNEQEIVSDLMGLALSSKAVLAIIPMQDVLGLGNEARMNTPGTGMGNWGWRYAADQIEMESIEALRELTEKTSRL